MKNLSTTQFTGITAIVSAVLYLLSIIGLQYYISVDLGDIAAFANNMKEHHHLMLMYGWPGLFATVFILPLVLYIYLKDSTSFLGKNLFIITIIGLIFIAIAYLFHLALTYFYAPSIAIFGLQDNPATHYVFKNLIGLQDMFWLAGDLFAFLGIALLMWLNRNNLGLPSWLIIFGVVACILASAGSFSFIPAFKKVIGLSFIFIGGFALFTVWEIIAGILFIQKKI